MEIVRQLLVVVVVVVRERPFSTVRFGGGVGTVGQLL